MSLPDRNNPYSFEAFLNQVHGFDYYAEDPFLQKTLKYYSGDEFMELDGKLREFSPKVSYRWRPLSDKGGNPECMVCGFGQTCPMSALLWIFGDDTTVTPEKFCNVEDKTETWEQAKVLGRKIARRLGDQMRM